MLAVSAAYFGVFTDMYAVCYNGSLYNCAFFYHSAGHDHTVDDLGSGSDLGIRK